MVAIGYVRVSTNEQLNGYGLDIQRFMVEEQAEKLGLNLTLIYSDEGVSGTKDMSGRPGLAAMLKACGKGVVVIVPRLDRLARDLLVQENVLASIWQSGAEIVSCDENESALLVRDSVQDPTRRLLRLVMGAVYQFQRDMAVASMQRARKFKREAGGYVGSNPPFGWRAVRGTGKLVPNETEQWIIKLVCSLRQSGMTFEEIAEELHRRGYRRRGGGNLTKQFVHTIWAREVEEGRVSQVIRHQNRRVRPQPIKPAVRAVNSVRSS